TRSNWSATRPPTIRGREPAAISSDIDLSAQIVGRSGKVRKTRHFFTLKASINSAQKSHSSNSTFSLACSWRRNHEETKASGRLHYSVLRLSCRYRSGPVV